VAQISFTLSKRTDPGGVETIICTSSNSVVITGVDAELSSDCAIASPVTILASDRLVQKVFGVITGGGSAPTIQLDLEGSTAARFEVPTASFTAGINQLTGDATAGPGNGSQALTLATVNAGVGSFGTASSVPSVTVNAKGLVTAAANTSIQIAESQVTNLTTDLAAKADAKWSVVNGGNAAYTILAADRYVRSGTTLTANRTYTLPACAGGNIGEVHDIKNLPTQTFNVILAGDGSDTVEGSATITLNPGDSQSVICGAAGAWDVR